MRTVPCPLQAAARRHPGAVALAGPDPTAPDVTYAVLEACVAAAAARLHACGVGGGAHVAFYLPNGVPLVVLLLAAIRAGADVTDLTNIPGSASARYAQTDGQVDLQWEYTGGRTVRAKKGDIVWVPRGSVHHIMNVGDGLSLRLAVAMPPAKNSLPTRPCSSSSHNAKIIGCSKARSAMMRANSNTAAVPLPSSSAPGASYTPPGIAS